MARRRLPKGLADTTLRDIARFVEASGGSAHVQISFGGAQEATPPAEEDVAAIGFGVDPAASDDEGGTDDRTRTRRRR